MYIVDEYPTGKYDVHVPSSNIATNGDALRTTINTEELLKYKWVFAEATHAPGWITICLPVEFIIKMINKWDSNNSHQDIYINPESDSDIPSKTTGCNVVYSSRMNTSDGTTNGQLVISFTRVVNMIANLTQNSQGIMVSDGTYTVLTDKINFYSKNSSNASRKINIYLVR